MVIYVVRHGQTDYNLKNRFQGQTDIPLNKEGERQAKETAKKFENIKVDAILVSPLTRAKQTAQFISDITKVPMTIENRLIERSFGRMEGHHNRKECNIDMLLDYDKNYEIDDVEPIQELFKRIYEAMDDIIGEYKNKNKNILLVTHAGVCQAIECYFNGMPKDKNISALAPKNSEVRKYVI